MNVTSVAHLCKFLTHSGSGTMFLIELQPAKTHTKQYSSMK